MENIFKLEKKTAFFLKCAVLLGIIAPPCFGSQQLTQPVWQQIAPFISSSDTYNKSTYTSPQIRCAVKENSNFVAPLIDVTWRYGYETVMKCIRAGQKDQLNSILIELVRTHKQAEYNAFSWWLKKTEVRFDEVFQNHVWKRTIEFGMNQFLKKTETPVFQFIIMAESNKLKKNQTYLVHIQKGELSQCKTQLENIVRNHQAPICFKVDFSYEAGTKADLSCEEVPNNIQFISIKGDNITSIGDGFLSYCDSLYSVDLSGISNVTSIGANFLLGCESLLSLYLSPLSNLTKIGDGFLDYCASLYNVDLNGISNVTLIGDNFLFGCDSLLSLDLSPLSNLTSIGYQFLLACESLRSLDLSSLSKVTQIGSHFIHSCGALKTITTTGSSRSIKSNVDELKCNQQLDYNLQLVILDEDK